MAQYISMDIFNKHEHKYPQKSMLCEKLTGKIRTRVINTGNQSSHKEDLKCYLLL
jgi:hypothetical protein